MRKMRRNKCSSRSRTVELDASSCRLQFQLLGLSEVRAKPIRLHFIDRGGNLFGLQAGLLEHLHEMALTQPMGFARVMAIQGASLRFAIGADAQESGHRAPFPVADRRAA